MPDVIRQLLVTEAAIAKLGARGISTDDAHQLLQNRHAIARNPHGQPPGARRLLIGRTNGGRILTLIVEQTIEPTSWVIVTGWDASPRERRLIPS